MVVCYAAIANYNKLIRSFIQLSSATQAAGLANKYTQPQSGLDFSGIQIILHFFIAGLKFKCKWVSFVSPGGSTARPHGKDAEQRLWQILAFCSETCVADPGTPWKRPSKASSGKMGAKS